METLLKVDTAAWREEVQNENEFFDKIGDRLPPEIRAEQAALKKRLS